MGGVVRSTCYAVARAHPGRILRAGARRRASLVRRLAESRPCAQALTGLYKTPVLSALTECGSSRSSCAGQSLRHGRSRGAGYDRTWADDRARPGRAGRCSRSLRSARVLPVDYLDKPPRASSGGKVRRQLTHNLSLRKIAARIAPTKSPQMTVICGND